MKLVRRFVYYFALVRVVPDIVGFVHGSYFRLSHSGRDCGRLQSDPIDVGFANDWWTCPMCQRSEHLRASEVNVLTPCLCGS